MNVESWAPTEAIQAEAARDAAAVSKPVKVWAFFGALCAIFEIYLFVRWITGPYFTPVRSGPSDPPTLMKVSLYVYIVMGMATFMYFAYRFIVRPWRRDRTIGIDGLLYVGWLFVYWQDPLANYTNTLFTYNSWLPNMGSWAQYIPGWVSAGAPGRMLPEPVLFVLPAYSYAFVLAPIFGAWMMRRIKARWPSLTRVQLLMATLAAFVAFDVPLEGLVWCRLGFYTYGGGAVGPTLFKGHYYQLPLFEMLVAAFFFTAGSSMLYFKNDRGETIVERGVDLLKATPNQKLGLRLLAAIGAANALLFLFYNVPINLMSLHAHEWPADVQKRSYFTDYMCGADTQQMCPADSVPRFDNKTVKIDPNGRLVVPPGVTLPSPVPFDKAPQSPSGN